MKILILTQSSVDGMNYQLGKECSTLCGDNLIHLDNCSSFPASSIRDYDKIIMIIPEWNGSFPFTFKKLIDDSGYPSEFSGISILLIGTSDTTFGNIMGLNHIQYILELCGARVWSKKVSIPHIRSYSFDRHKNPEERLISTIKEFINSKNEN